MIRFIIRSVLIILILILLAPIVFAIDTVTRDNLFTEVRVLCGAYGKICYPQEYKDDREMWGQTRNDNVIVLSSGLIKGMNEAQVRGVLFHEVGHVVMRHVDKTIDYLSMCGLKCDPKAIAEMRRRYEYQADRFATFVGIFTHKEVDLEGALLILTPKEEINTTQDTHPSTADRIRAIQTIRRNYE